MMNQTIRTFTESKIVEGLQQLPTGHNEFFKKMYARNGGKRSLEDALAMDINNVVKEIPDDKIGWALTQVEASLKKQSEKSEKEVKHD